MDRSCMGVGDGWCELKTGLAAEWTPGYSVITALRFPWLVSRRGGMACCRISCLRPACSGIYIGTSTPGGSGS